MKKLMIGSTLAVFLAAGSIGIYAAPGKDHGPNRPPHKQESHFKQDFHGGADYHEREDGRYIIHRTALVFHEAERWAGHGRYYSGYAEMIAHQRRAQELYMRGCYRESIFHSLRAREMAMVIIRENHGHCDDGFYRDGREEVYFRESPHGSDLNIGLDIRKFGRDDQAFRLHLNFDL